MSMSRNLFLLIFFAILLLAGCSAAPEKVVVVDKTTSSVTFEDQLGRHTRKVELYDKLDTVAKGWASWRSPALLEAEAVAMAENFGATPDEITGMVDSAKKAGLTRREFHLSLYTGNPDWNDLDRADSMWKSYVTLPRGERFEPVEVKALSKDAKSRTPYPYVTRWSREYLLVFPLLEPAGAGERPRLTLTGPLGTLDFDF